MKTSTVTGKPGSLDNPEVLENVPGHIIPVLREEFDDFDHEAGKFLGGETDELEFIPFRLRQGVYGQRQPNVQMVRVKLPFGGINPEQMEAFADGIEKYVPLKKGHITTRQNVQMHHVPLDDAAKLIRELGPSGLSSREAAATRCATSPATRGPASARASSSTRRSTRARTCATSCATPRRS
jgi:sulfite reductase beta subunit-like hemoprotein